VTSAQTTEGARVQSWQLLRALPAASESLTAVTAALVVVSAVIPAALMILVGWLVGQVPKLVEASSRSATWPSVVTGVCLLAVLMAVQQVVNSLLGGLGERLGRQLSLSLRERLMSAMLRPVGLAHLESSDVQDLAAVAAGIRGGYAGPMGAVVGLVQSSATGLSGIAAAGVLFFVAPVLAGPLLVLHLLVGWWSRREHQRGLSVLFVDASRLRRSAYFRDLILRPGAEKELRIFGLSQFALERFTSNWISVMRTAWRARHSVNWFTSCTFVILAVSYALCAIELAHSAQTGVLSIARLAVALQAILGLLPLAMVSEWDELIQAGRDAVGALSAAERKIAATVADQPSSDGRTAPRVAHDITLEGVRFAYPGGADVLRGVDLAIPVGRSCAIVGRNGSGKSTLLKLLLRFYEPTAGSIRADGVPIADLDPDAWRTQFSAVFQDFLRLSVTVRDAIEFGSLDHRGNPVALAEAADKAGLTGVVEALESGWDTLLSPQMRGGTDLSGGEWQKVAIARALYSLAHGAEVLAMDEPTASLDADSERQVYESILAAGAGRTLILVSHRFATVRKVDQIFVLADGVIVEHGNHDELMAREGLYAEMFTTQAGLLL
jgi:ATP-binding cassette, subfamily B, bacterial